MKTKTTDRRIRIRHDDDREMPDWLETRVSYRSGARYLLGTEAVENEDDWLVGLLGEGPLPTLKTLQAIIRESDDAALHADFAEAMRVGGGRRVRRRRQRDAAMDFLLRIPSSAFALNGAMRERIFDALRERGDFIAPVYAHIHSGVALRLDRGFGDPWDSGRSGLCYMAMHVAKSKWVEKPTRESVERMARGEFAAVKAYIEGEVFGFEVEERDPPKGECPHCGHDDADDEDSWSYGDSCWGFYGRDIEGVVEHSLAPVEVVKEAFDSIGEWVEYASAAE